MIEFTLSALCIGFWVIVALGTLGVVCSLFTKSAEQVQFEKMLNHFPEFKGWTVHEYLAYLNKK